MNTIDEQLWNYIDGNCDAREKAEIETKIAGEPKYQEKYQELLAVHRELNLLEEEEPSLSFTRNVMNLVALEPRPVTLKTKIDIRIIYSIGAFFAISIVGIFCYAVSITDFNLDFQWPKTHLSYNVSKLFTPSFLNIFLLLDVGLALVYLDGFLKKRKDKSEQVKH
jgi:hypothetical protein